MAHLTTPSVGRQIESLFDGGSVAGLTDRQLIERFYLHRDHTAESAFAAIVQRHGPMVLHVCRQLLADHHHSEDAFQAVFLVLARKARSIRDPDLLGNWLYGVALRTARKAKIRLARQRRNLEDDAMAGRDLASPDTFEPAAPPADQPALAREQVEALHDELKRLPKSFRLPVVLCYFEGLTLDEAARRLRWPAGTLRSRLARAREKLRRSLTRRGIVLTSAALATALNPRPASASISSPLCRLTTKAAIDFAAGQALSASAMALTLAQEVLRAMLFHKLRLTVLTVLLSGALATGAGFLSRSLAMKNEPQKPPAGPQLQAAAKPDNAGEAPVQAPAPGRMFVIGRVLDPEGKPLSGVPVDLVGQTRKVLEAADEMLGANVLLGQGATDVHGRFRLDASRTSSLHFYHMFLLAAAPGGFGWADLNLDAGQPAAEIRLKPEQLIRGRLVDIHGQPAAGVGLRVDHFGQAANLGRSPDIWLGNHRPAGARTWPLPIKTDDQGRFTFRGLGRGLGVWFAVHDRRFAPQGFGVATDDRDGPKEVTQALQPPRIVEGRVIVAETGQPIQGAVVELSGAKLRTDETGRFQARPSPPDRFSSGDRFGVTVFPPVSQAYLVSRAEFAWTKGAVKKEVEIKVPRGVLIRGKVTEEKTGRALAGASVMYLAIQGKPEHKGSWDAAVASQNDGSFEIVVPPGKGHLVVFGPTSNYILDVIGEETLFQGQPGGRRNYAHQIIAYEVKAGDSPHAIDAALRPGKTVKGRVVGPRGETVENAAILTRAYIEPLNWDWRCDMQPRARDGFFELHGLDPEKSVPVYFLDLDHEWGAAVELSGKQAAQEVTIRLQPNGQAKARFVKPDSKPIAKMLPQIEIVVTPGPIVRRGALSADSARLLQVDSKHYWRPNRLVTDENGRITFPDLIPGALYRISDFSPSQGWQVRRDFTVKPGETIDLGEILIETPRS
jgi:RNA polymerase sigma factor (sigma-70 family)